MATRECSRCKATMNEMAGQYVLLHGDDLPAFGSRTEIMITPKKTQRVHAYRCENPSCLTMEFTAG